MKKFFKKKKSVLFLCLFVLLTCTACSNPRGSDGKTKVNEIIASEEIQIKKSQVNTTEINDKKLEKEYKKLKDDDMITIHETSFMDAFSNGWFEGLVVWPLAQCINFFASFTDAGIGIILTTILLQGIVFVMTYKSQMGNQRMQEVQPEMMRIQDKYKDKTDDRSRMMMAQEMQKLYQKYDIHPFGTILVTFIQLPILMGMYYATMRAASVVYGSFIGLPFIGTPMDGFKNGQIGYIVIWALMIICQLLTMKTPQLLKKWQDKKDHVKKKAYAEPQNPMMGGMNLYMYFMTAMIAFMCFSWPIAMSFYWLISSLINIIKSVAMHVHMQKSMQHK